MDLKDIKTLQEVSREFGIPQSTLRTRLESKKRGMIEGIDFKRLGPRMPILFSPDGVSKITNGRDPRNGIKSEIL